MELAQSQTKTNIEHRNKLMQIWKSDTQTFQISVKRKEFGEKNSAETNGYQNGG